METLWQDARFAFRMLLKTPGFTAVAALTLALGIGANTAIFSVVHAVLLRPLPYPDPDRLVMLWERSPQLGLEQERVTPANFVDWREQNQVFEQMGFWPAWTGSQEFNLIGQEGAEQAQGAYVSASLFAVMGVKPILGRTFLPDEDQREGNRAVVLSYELWQRRYGGDPDILGRTLVTDSFRKRDFTVVGVMPQGFQFPDQAELWLPAGWMGVGMDRRAAHWFKVVARLNPGVTLRQAKQEMDMLAARLAAQYPEARIGSEVKIVSLLDQSVGSVKPALLVLVGAVAFVLLIACANVANMLLARANARHAEMAIRAALGASPWRIVRQLLIECLLLALPSGAVGAVSAWWGTRLLVALSASQIPRLGEIAVAPSVLAFTLLLSLLAALIFGLVPALQAAKPDLVEALKSGGRNSSDGLRRNAMRNLLVIAEVALALVLLIGAGLMIRSLLRLQQVNPGFRPEPVLTAEIDMSSSAYSNSTRPGPNRPQAFFQRLIERLQRLPGVASAGGAINLPLSPASMQSFAIEGRTGLSTAEFPMATNRAITPGYFDTLGVPLMAGRDFTERDNEAAQGVAIINEALARRYFPGEDPVGKRLDFGFKERLDRDGKVQPIWQEIIGVVGDVKNAGLETEAPPEVYKPYLQWSWHKAYLLIRTTGDPRQLAATLPGEVKALNADQPVSKVRTMEQILGDLIALPRLRARLLGLFALVALLLSAVGIYGVISYMVTQRTQEVGLRMALGAQAGDVLRLMVGQGMRLTLIGVVVGLLAAVALTRVMGGLLYEVQPRDPLTFVGVSVLLVFTALIACWIPARRASKLDPMAALRHE